MGRTPLWARRPSSLAAVALIAFTSTTLPATGASGKRPWGPPPGQAAHGGGPSASHGNGNGHGNGHGPQAAAPATSPAPAAAAPTTSVAAPSHGPGNGHGNGHAYGHSNGHGNPHSSRGSAAPTAAARPTTSAVNPSTSAAGSAGGGSSSGSGAGTPPPTTSPPATSGPSGGGGAGNPHGGSGAPHARGGKAGRRTRQARLRTKAQRAQARKLAAVQRRQFAVLTGAGGQTPIAALTGTSTQGDPGAAGGDSTAPPHHSRGAAPAVVRTLEHVVRVIPTFVKALVVVMGFLLLIAALAWFLLARTTRFLRRQREMLLGEIGTLQGALLPSVPPELNRLQASVAYRPAEGLAAGGDFYDAFPLDDGRVGIVVGDVAGHGKEALMHTALLRYTLRAYLEADLEPRVALQVAGRSLDRGFDTLATVVLAVYDPSRHVLRYASAGHPPPVFLGDADHVPVTQASSPPIGAGLPTGLRQTTVSLATGSAVCFFTDGLIEARRDNQLIGRLGLVDIIRDLGPSATAAEVLERVAAEADQVTDDMAACMFRVGDGPRAPVSPRVEEIEVLRGEPLDATLGRFLAACDVDADRIDEVIASAERTVKQFRAALVRVSHPRGGPRIEVAPANVERIGWTDARRAAV